MGKGSRLKGWVLKNESINTKDSKLYQVFIQRKRY